jgi:hypothetical protein
MRLKGIRVFNDDDEDLDHLDEEKALKKPGDEDLPWSAVRIMAACHSLAIRVTRGKNGISSQVIGDPLEQTVLENTGYDLVRFTCVFSPLYVTLCLALNLTATCIHFPTGRQQHSHSFSTPEGSAKVDHNPPSLW